MTIARGPERTPIMDLSSLSSLLINSDSSIRHLGEVAGACFFLLFSASSSSCWLASDKAAPVPFLLFLFFFFLLFLPPFPVVKTLSVRHYMGRASRDFGFCLGFTLPVESRG